MWNAKVVNLLSDISDSVGVLTDMPEIPAEVFWFRALKNTIRKLLKSAFRFIRSKLVKTDSIYDWVQDHRGSNY